MVKLFAFLYRRDGMSHDEFLDHWRDHHGPLIAGTETLARHIVRYEQHPRHSSSSLSGTEGCDGVTVQWMESLDSFRAFISEPDYAAVLAPDEQRFLDMSKVTFVICDEANVVIGGSGE